MLRHEIQNKTGLTRKALEYYEEKGLVHPQKLENGYREYSAKDQAILHKISLFRKLGLSLSEIEQCLSRGEHSLTCVLRKREHQSAMEEKKKAVMREILQGETQERLLEKIASIEAEETIYEKLEKAFPGYFGQMIFSAYQPFLNEVLTEEGAEAYAEYVRYLDALPSLPLSQEEQKYLDEVSAPFDMATLKRVNEEKVSAMEKGASWWEDNEAFVRQYEAYKNSAAYQNSLMKHIQDKLSRFLKENKYYETAIPLIRKFSLSYDAYYQKALKANEEYLKFRDKQDKK